MNGRFSSLSLYFFSVLSDKPRLGRKNPIFAIRANIFWPQHLNAVERLSGRDQTSYGACYQVWDTNASSFFLFFALPVITHIKLRFALKPKCDTSHFWGARHMA